MTERILQKATELFITLGFKSVTMDDIASNLGISKKTLYKHFSNKTELVDETTNHMFSIISLGIDEICASDLNPIAEIFEIKNLMMRHLKDEKSSPQYQLQRYYPNIFSSLKKKQFKKMQECTIENIKKGKEQGLYRADLDIDFVTRIYFIGAMGIKDKDYFPLKDFSMSTLTNYFLEYHLRGICSEKGIIELQKQLEKNKTTN
ncbi:MAG: TetR family transcriptional regulator [Flavobacteriaceae bacterium]|nr:TetR family transcriptional regulator [Flavobacteriaceae bacterium]|tara:strand:- start:511214 stop:511825 length:612 start_codon:yes stop_codon:yes gene_type:complete